MTSQNLSSQTSLIYNSRKNVLNLMKRQGFNTDDNENFSINEINTMRINNQLDMLLEKTDEDEITKRKSKIYIKYNITKSIRPANIQEIIDDLFNLEEVLTKADSLFIITKEDMNDTITSEIKHIWESDGYFVVIQNIKRLQFNILDHTLVPEHRVMKSEEVAKLMKKYNISNITELPDISRFDPVAQVIGLRPGQVCHIIRPSKTSIQTDYYRACI
jgi:DNA-directed RNA polymerase I, II, and III subunit RPABC1